jgi:hypothetical protein
MPVPKSLVSNVSDNQFSGVQQVASLTGRKIIENDNLRAVGDEGIHRCEPMNPLDLLWLSGERFGIYPASLSNSTGLT